MTKKLIAFDLDDTLSISKSAMSDEMAALFGKLLEKYEVCIISGGKFEQFKIQVIDRIIVPKHALLKLHLMPTCGTRYYRYDESKQDWALQYSEDLSTEEKTKIISVLQSEEKNFDLKNQKTWGDIIEDRGSQIAYSILGQQAPPEEKYKWAEHYSDIKKAFRDKVAEQLPNLEVRLGGSTTLDITKLGIDKAYGMDKLITELEISKDEILFMGDKLQEGGNDYPVKAMGIDTIAVKCWQDTALVVETILKVG